MDIFKLVEQKYKLERDILKELKKLEYWGNECVCEEYAMSVVCESEIFYCYMIGVNYCHVTSV